MYLYHGTRDTKPEEIYKSEEGFDLRFARQGGKWGFANYFALNASYSDNGYKHTLADGTFQMFYARVIIGKSVQWQASNNIRMPPLI
jgi:Poly(ADP-ribose) polymerase catalytic domain